MKDIYFNKRQIEALQPAEKHFDTAVHSQYKRMTTRQVNELVQDTYKEATGIDLNTNFNCPKCCYDTYVKVGRLYYKSIEHLNESERGLNPEENNKPQEEAVTYSELSTLEKKRLSLAKAREAKKNKNK